MSRKWILVVCVAQLCILAGGSADAAVIRYTLNGVNFQAPYNYTPVEVGSDGSAVGTFDYDTSTQKISNISITTTSVPGTLACYEPNSRTCAWVNYTGSNYISVNSGASGGATAQLLPDPSNGNYQEILFSSNANGGGSVYVYPGGAAHTQACNAFFSGGCTLSLRIPNNSLNAGGVIQLVSEVPNGTQTAPGSADPTGVAVCGQESWVGQNSQYVRYIFAAPSCGNLSGMNVPAPGPAPSGAGGGMTSLATFALLVGTYMLARAWRRRRGAPA